jgi:hypothetical protein
MVGYLHGRLFQRQSVAPLIIIVTAPLVEIAPLIAKSVLSISIT